MSLVRIESWLNKPCKTYCKTVVPSIVRECFNTHTGTAALPSSKHTISSSSRSTTVKPVTVSSRAQYWSGTSRRQPKHKSLLAYCTLLSSAPRANPLACHVHLTFAFCGIGPQSSCPCCAPSAAAAAVCRLSKRPCLAPASQQELPASTHMLPCCYSKTPSL
jgi:hypothetical protein